MSMSELRQSAVQEPVAAAYEIARLRADNEWLREALSAIAEGRWALGAPEYADNPRRFARDALRASQGEQEPV